MTSENKDIVVAVTGASGYVAGEVIKQLLERGYTVKGSVRSLNNVEKIQHLKETFPNLQLFEADLLQEGSFEEAFKGCTFVMHTASPFQIEVEDPQRDLVEPALKGTLNVLRAAVKVGTVKRTIITSSVAAIIGDTVDEEKIYSEEDWNNDSTLETGPYRLSKTLAEKAAWDFIKKHQEDGGKMDIVVINPSFVLGPPLSARTDSTSVKVASSFLDGRLKESGTKPLCFGCVDIRDVARAHVAAMEKPEASGRYIVSSSEGISHLELAQMLLAQEELKEYPIPTKASAPFSKRPKLNNQKVQRELGFTLTPINQSFVDMAHALINLGIVSKQN